MLIRRSYQVTNGHNKLKNTDTRHDSCIKKECSHPLQNSIKDSIRNLLDKCPKLSQIDREQKAIFTFKNV